VRGEANERAIVLVVAAAQFINVLEFVIVMPLGPDYATALHVASSQLPYVAAAYTAAAALAGIAGAFFLDRFDRRRALLCTLGGLVLCTASAGLAPSFAVLVGLRALAGLFGGPATSIAMSIVADAVPAERRGRAMSVVLLAFSMAAIFGVPAGLELARGAGWRAPFLAIAALGLPVLLLTARLPSLRAHIAAASTTREAASLRPLLGNATVLRSYAMTLALQLSGFLIIPNISPYLQHNAGFPRARLGALYLAGGVVSLAATRLAGWLVDRAGSLPIASVGLALLSTVIVGLFVHPVPAAFIPYLFCGGYMFAQALRNVAYNTLTSKVPRPEERARFQSLQSTVTHLSIASGSALAARLLSSGPRGELIGMPAVGWLSIAVSALVPLLMWRVEGEVRRSLPTG
jgi:predicted MFS family arabinose efflux permease